MKNLLWIFYKPIDEREELIYKGAFERAFVALTIVIALGWYLATIFPDAMSGFAAWNMTFLGMFLAYGAGWYGLRKEDLALQMPPLPEIRAGRFFAIFAGIAAILPVSMFLIFIDVIDLAHLTRIIIGMLVLLEITAIYWTWRVTAGLSHYVRFLASILLAPGFILFLKWKRKNLFTFLGSQAIAYGALIAAMLVLMTPFAFFIAWPYPVENNDFAPVLEEGDIVFLDLRKQDMQTGDYVVYAVRADDGPEDVLGKIEAVNGLEYTVSGRQVPWQEILGELVLDSKF